MQTDAMDPESKKARYLEMSRLRWELVERGRQGWNTLSLAVVAAGLWLLSHGGQGVGPNLLNLVAGPICLVFALLTMAGQHAMHRVQRQLEWLQRSTGCRQTYPLVQLTLSSKIDPP